MEQTDNKRWTHTVYLVIDAIGEEREPEAAKLRVGEARLRRNDLHVQLAPGLSVSGRLVFKLKEDFD